MSFINHRDYSYAQFEDKCHNNMHFIVDIVSKSVYHGSNVLFLGVLSNHVVTAADKTLGLRAWNQHEGAALPRVASPE